MKSRKLSFVNINAAPYLKQIIKLLPVLLVLALAITACSGGGITGASEDTGTVNISFSRSSASREAFFPPGDNVVLLEHKLIFQGNGGTLSFSVGIGVTSYTATVPAGNWNLTVKAYYKETFLYAKGITL